MIEDEGTPARGHPLEPVGQAPIATATGPERTARRLGLQIFAAESHAPRSRRWTDAVILGVAMALAGGLALVVDDPSRLEDGWHDVAAALPGWLQWLADVTYTVATAWLVVLVVGMGVVARRRRDLLRDMVLAIVLAVGIVVALGRLVDDAWPELVVVSSDGTASTFPALVLTVLTAVQATADPHLSRPMRRLGWTITLAGAAAALLANLTEVRDTMGAIVVGLGVAMVVRLALGTPAGRPSLARIRSALAELGLDANDLAYAEDQASSATVARACSETTGTLVVRVYGRDALTSQFLNKVWRFAWYQDSGPGLGMSRMQQVEHAALAQVLAGRAGVNTPALVALGEAGAGDALLVTGDVGRPLGRLARDDVTEPLLRQAWSQLTALHRGQIAYGQANLDHLLVDRDGEVMAADFTKAEVAATSEARGVDCAELLTSTALVVGTDRAVEIAATAIGPDALATTLPFLQGAGLTPELHRRVLGERLSLRALRHRAAVRAGTEAPALEQLHRVSLGRTLMTGLTVLAVYAVIGGLSGIDWDSVGETLRTASWPLVIVALLLSQVTNVASAVSVLGASPRPLPLGLVTLEQLAVSFINLAVPSTAARVAVNMRFFQQFGIAVAAATTAGLLTSVTYFLVQAVLMVLAVLPGEQSIDLSQLELSGDVVRILALVLALVIVGVAILLVLPRARAWLSARVAEPMHQARAGVKVLASPRAAGMVFGGNLASQLLFAAALALCVHAVGGDVSFGEVVFVNTVVSLLAGLLPIPGGIGVTEAGLTAGLMAVGVDEATAVSAVIIYRLCSFYLPPVWGWFAMRWLTSRNYL